MTAKLAETQLWQQNMASLIRSGLFSKADTGEMNGLYTVVGVYVDETFSAPLAKYSDLRRATDAANLVNQLAKVRPIDRVELILENESKDRIHAMAFRRMKPEGHGFFRHASRPSSRSHA